jgi:hypothetical protein
VPDSLRHFYLTTRQTALSGVSWLISINICITFTTSPRDATRLVQLMVHLAPALPQVAKKQSFLETVNGKDSSFSSALVVLGTGLCRPVKLLGDKAIWMDCGKICGV